MEESILTSTKKILGLSEEYTVFDDQIVTFINGALSTAEEIGVSLAITYIEDKSATWEDLTLDRNVLSMLKNYIYLKSRMLFDPPGTSFVIDAMNQQIAELEWRMQVKERELHPIPEGGTV